MSSKVDTVTTIEASHAHRGPSPLNMFVVAWMQEPVVVGKRRGKVSVFLEAELGREVSMRAGWLSTSRDELQRRLIDSPFKPCFRAVKWRV